MNSNIPSQSKHQNQLNNMQQSFSNLQSQCSSLLHNVSQKLNPNIFSALNSFRDQAKQALDSGISRFNPVSRSGNAPLWARISEGDGGGGGARTQVTAPVRGSSGKGLSADAIEERLAGVPVYALSNSNEEFVLVSGTSTGKSLGLLFCKEEDADTLLRQMKSMDPRMRTEGSKVVALALSKVFQLKVNGVAFRLIPESTQVKNALKERKTAGIDDDDFHGVPVFQSKSLILRSENMSYRPVFFRKEDLEKSLVRASSQQNRLNPALKPGDIQVAVFEDIVKEMKESTSSSWDDIVFIPPGFEVSTEQTQE
ncbi:PREDICTED: protein TIC 22-like, chloroplastic isoform X1 [Camelina sativa]|uniref:Protein TIC 22-like, chloroplastic isoform X1 n=1 Tax=Camelina sativa TaxID=90675 RepID=A0ABM0XNA2_CAMSA|nr:PREDICTED: protein TIC 22-like, chloroplastic isoform X1 [Camelina sativa]